MTEPTTWERVDEPATTPTSIAAGRAGDAGDGGDRSANMPVRRLRRSRSPVMAAFDAGGEIFQRRLRTMLVGSAAILAPLVAVNLWVTVVGFDRFDPDDSLFPSLGSDVGSGIEDLAPFVGAVATSMATAIVGYFVAVVAIADRFGRPVPGLLAALGATLRSLPRLVALWIVGHWWQPLLVVVVVSADSEDVGGLVFVMGVIALFASAATLWAVPVMVTEGLGPIGALRRSWRMFRRSAGSALGFVTLSTLLGSALLFGVGTIAPLLEANGFLGFGDATWIVQGVLVQLAVLLVMPLVACCTAQSCVEVRLEREGLDLELDADRAFGTDSHPSGRDAITGGAPA